MFDTRGKNVDDILNMTVTEAMEFFSLSAESRRIAKRLKVLDDVGLGYLRLGQPATTLSGGEAQRIKLAHHLRRASRKARRFLFSMNQRQDFTLMTSLNFSSALMHSSRRDIPSSLSNIIWMS